MKYLIRDRGKKQKAHVWTGSDTLCTMASTGGLKLDDFSVCDSTLGHEICWMCAQAMAGGKRPVRPKVRARREEKRRKRKQRLLFAPGEIFYASKPWNAMRRRVFATYGRRCMKCDVVGGELHVDHIKPRSKFPELSLTFENLQVLCRDCNMAKWNYHATDYREEAVSRELDRQTAREASARI